MKTNNINITKPSLNHQFERWFLEVANQEYKGHLSLLCANIKHIESGKELI